MATDSTRLAGSVGATNPGRVRGLLFEYQRPLAWGLALCCVGLAIIAWRAETEIAVIEHAYPAKPWQVEAMEDYRLAELEEEVMQDEPKPQPGPGQLRFVGRIWHEVSAYTKWDDPGFGKRYASVNFLPGGKHYDPSRPYPRSTKVKDSDFSVAVPRRFDRLFSERTGRGDHLYRLRIPGYGIAVPRDRITKHDRFDVLMTGWNAQRRARKWGVKLLGVEVFEVVE